MKKYFAAAAVAVMVFAFAAMAASLTVEGGTLQAGSDVDLTCTEAVNVDFTGFEGDPVDASGTAGTSGGFTTITLGGLDGCEGASVYTRVFDNDGDEIWRSDPIPTATAAASQDFSGGLTQSGYALYGQTAAQAQSGGTVVLSVDIARVDVQIDG